MTGRRKPHPSRYQFLPVKFNYRPLGPRRVSTEREAADFIRSEYV